MNDLSPFLSFFGQKERELGSFPSSSYKHPRRGRKATQDEVAFRKRVEKRRKKKGYR